MKKTLKDLLKDYNGEEIKGKDLILYVFPDTKDKELIKKKLDEIVPKNKSFRIIEGIKRGTVRGITRTVRGKVKELESISKPDKHLLMSMKSIPSGESVEELIGVLTGKGKGKGKEITRDSEEWGEISKILYEDGYYRSWEIRLNGETVLVYHKIITKEHNRMQELGMNITKDNITDLRIALETDSIESFIEDMVTCD